MSDFYKMDPGAWDYGTANLTLEQEAAYLRIVNAMHKHKSGVPDNDRVLAGLFRCSTRKARTLVKALENAGKVDIADGIITNKRAISDLVRRGFVSVSRSEAGAKGGRTRADNAAKALKEQEPDQAIGSSREEKSREEKSSVTNVTGADAPIDPAKIAFDEGRKLLAKAGIPDRQARSIIGKWRRDHPDPAIIDAIGRTIREGASDPVEFVTGCLRSSKRRAKPEAGATRTTPDGKMQTYHPFEGWMTTHA